MKKVLFKFIGVYLLILFVIYGMSALTSFDVNYNHWPTITATLFWILSGIVTVFMIVSTIFTVLRFKYST